MQQRRLANGFGKRLERLTGRFGVVLSKKVSYLDASASSEALALARSDPPMLTKSDPRS
jgi:hypothetical protein